MGDREEAPPGAASGAAETVPEDGVIPARRFYSQRGAPCVLEANSKRRRAHPESFAPQEFRFFPTLQECFDAGRGSPEALFFCSEDPRSSQRRFSFASVDRFWSTFLAIDPEDRHFYEIIRESSPCHLYLDVEYLFEFNPDRALGPRVMRELRYLLLHAFLQFYDVYLDERSVVELDSTSDRKFSRHLLIRCPGAMFASNLELKGFVLAALGRSAESFWVRKSDGSLTSVVDLGVYTRNRLFRTLLSSKWGQAAVLKPVVAEAGLFESQSRLKALFLRSLITYRDASEGSDAESLRLLTSPGGPLSSSRPLSSPEWRVSSAPLPPSLQSFLDPHVSVGGAEGRIRCYRCRGEFDLTLEMSQNRFCRRIGRSHRSNNVFFVLDAVQGVMVQRCHDADCGGFQSSPIALPSEALDSLRSFLRERSAASESSSAPSVEPVCPQ